MADDDLPSPLFENNRAPILGFDRDTLAVLTVNQAAVRHYGYSQAEFLGMRITDIHPSDGVPSLVARCAMPGEDCKLDPIRAGVYQHRKKDGTLIETDIICYPIPYNGRDAIFMLMTDACRPSGSGMAIRPA